MSLRKVHIDDKYLLEEGHVYLTGIQALVRLALQQRARDQADGLRTAGFISGYRGSPLGALDQQLRRAEAFLDAHRVRFVPGVNEDLAATSVWGTQQAELSGEGAYDGVFAMWYGKGPGVDRSGDALRHGNLAGSSTHGGVLCLLGDDHVCESSTTAHQSEFAMVDAMIPVLNPAGVQDLLDFGMFGWALSRYSGCWVSLKCVHDTVEAAASVEVSPARARARLPAAHPLPAGGLNIRWPDTPQAQEQRLHEHKLPAVRAFLRANALDRVVLDAPRAHLGIVTTGKSYLDVRAALGELGIDGAEARRLGLRLYKVAAPWPLEPAGLREFARGLRQLVVVEEKRALIEDQVRAILYAGSERPQIVGKFDDGGVEAGRWLFPSAGRLGSMHIALAVGERLHAATGDEMLAARLGRLRELAEAITTAPAPLTRTPYFCAGCPHNASTRVPEGSRALAGIGCHYMAQWMDRETARFTQMGAEGASWLGESLFSRRRHMFQNIGDGTYFHSGLLAVRATVAAGTNITFKILYNDAVAMTGGQPMDGPLTVPQISWQVHAEGVQRIAVVTDEPDKYPAATRWAPGTSVHHRRELDAVQRELRARDGTTVLIYDQTCAAEKRRRRKRGAYPDPPRRAFINEAVCEGCGDCGVQSNCVAIVPVETPLGRKRQVDQSACNKDFSCLQGFCPSFVTVRGGELRRQGTASPRARADGGSADGGAVAEPVPAPVLPALGAVYRIVLTGVGGTGVVTIGALLGMAAHLEGKGCSVLDMAGLAQKGGAVMSHIVLGTTPADITATHVPSAGADLLLGGDLVVSASAPVLDTVRAGVTRAVVNSYEMMTGDFARQADLGFPAAALRERIATTLGTAPLDFVNTTRAATRLFGDSIAANLYLLGFAFQRGHLPLGAAAIERAIELNAVAVDLNRAAFAAGRLAAHAPQAMADAAGALDDSPAPAPETDLNELVTARSAALTRYQSARYARRYRRRVGAVRAADGDGDIARAVAANYAKLLAYKDEYEVARLFTDGEFERRLHEVFSGDYELRFHLAPPLLARRDPHTRAPRKREFGPWMMGVMRLLARMRWLRGTPFDPFGYSADRRLERRLLREYERELDAYLRDPQALAQAHWLTRLRAPERIRGFGHVKRASVEASLLEPAARTTP